MKNIFLALLTLLSYSVFSASHTMLINGISYSPSNLSAQVGDTVTISASGSHPLVQVDSTTWQANGSTELVGGWGTKTSNYTFEITANEDIYFVCLAHVLMGMKGKISVSSSGCICS
jgi:plastocyanin